MVEIRLRNQACDHEGWENARSWTELCRLNEKEATPSLHYQSEPLGRYPPSSQFAQGRERLHTPSTMALAVSLSQKGSRGLSGWELGCASAW